MTTSVFWFSDIEGSTRLWAAHPDSMGAVLERHDEIVLAAVRAAGGLVFKHTGDGVVARFDSAAGSIRAAVAVQRGLAAGEWGPVGVLRVRIGVHAGEAQEREGDWFGPALNRAARLTAVGHGGQVLVSSAAAELGRHDLVGVALVDLGLHRLRDLAEPEHVWQVAAVGLAEAFPPLTSLNATVTNLPSELTAFFGREGEVAELTAELARHRLVTLAGPGGVGKTRLAMQAAADGLSSFADGVWVCKLGTVADPAALDHAVLAELGYVVRPGATPRVSLLEALSLRDLLLVVDNCEHLRAAAAELVNAVLQAAPGVKVLATSREPLGVPGERLWAVEPLHVEGAAVDLFVERAAAVRRGFELTDDNRAVIGDICARLDGLPLAIELAAARAHLLSLEDLLERLGARFRLLTAGRSAGRPGRQATLRAAVDWSYGMLDAEEGAIFDRLSVFAGGFDLAAAVAVAARPGVDELDVLDLLGALVDKSLVQVLRTEGSARYGLLETMRQYGAEHVRAANGHEGLAGDHATYYGAFAERAALGLRGADEAAWARAIDADFDNIRLAARWALDHKETDLALRLVTSLWTYPTERVVLEPAEWAEEALTLPDSDRHPLASLAHATAGWGAQQSGRYADTLQHGEAAIARAEANAPEHLWVAYFLSLGGALFLGQLELAQTYVERVVPSARAVGDDWAISRALWAPLMMQPTFPTDIEVHAGAAECLAIAERLANPALLARAHLVNGVVSGRRAPEVALEHFAAAERFARPAGLRYLVGFATAYAAGARAVLDPHGGLEELLRTLDWRQATGVPMGIMRITLRDLFPALDGLGLYGLIVILDAHLPAHSFFNPKKLPQPSNTH